MAFGRVIAMCLIGCAFGQVKKMLPAPELIGVVFWLNEEDKLVPLERQPAEAKRDGMNRYLRSNGAKSP